MKGVYLRFVRDDSESSKLRTCSLGHSNGRCPGCDIYRSQRCILPARTDCVRAHGYPIFLGEVHRARLVYIHIGVGSDVVCSTTMGNARASNRGTDNKTTHVFCYTGSQAGPSIPNEWN